MKPALIDALQDEIRTEIEGAIVTNAIAIIEFFDPVENAKMIVTMGAGADGTPISPWLASGMLEIGCHSDIRSSHLIVDEEAEESDDAEG